MTSPGSCSHEEEADLRVQVAKVFLEKLDHFQSVLNSESSCLDNDELFILLDELSSSISHVLVYVKAVLHTDLPAIIAGLWVLLLLMAVAVVLSEVAH